MKVKALILEERKKPELMLKGKIFLSHNLAEIMTRQGRYVKIDPLILLSQGPMASVTKKRRITITLLAFLMHQY